MTKVGSALCSAIVPVAMVLVSACSGSSQPAAVAPTTTVATTAVVTTSAPGVSSSTTVPIQTSGPRTVLSPLGLNVRAAPAKTAAVVGTAAQGATLTVLDHTDQGGGWYQVKGATVTGYITDNPVLSANGKFTSYSSTEHNFSLLYPEHWTIAQVPPASVVFRAMSGSDSVAVTTAATLTQLGRGRAGYQQTSSAMIVVCGVTGNFVTFTQTGGSTPPSSVAPAGVVAERYLVQVHLTLDAQHALGVDANLAELANLQTVKDVVNSMSFPFPQCELGATPNQTSSTGPPTTVH